MIKAQECNFNFLSRELAVINAFLDIIKVKAQLGTRYNTEDA